MYTRRFKIFELLRYSMRISIEINLDTERNKRYKRTRFGKIISIRCYFEPNSFHCFVKLKRDAVTLGFLAELTWGDRFLRDDHAVSNLFRDRLF